MRGAQVFFCLLRDWHIQELNTLGQNGTSTLLATTFNQTSFPERCPLFLVLFTAIFWFVCMHVLFLLKLLRHICNFNFICMTSPVLKARLTNFLQYNVLDSSLAKTK